MDYAYALIKVRDGQPPSVEDITPGATTDKLQLAMKFKDSADGIYEEEVKFQVWKIHVDFVEKIEVEK